MIIGYLLIGLFSVILYITFFHARMNFNLRIVAAFFMLLVVLLIIFLVDPENNSMAENEANQGSASSEKNINHKIIRSLNSR